MLTDADLRYYSRILDHLQNDCGNADLFLLEPEFSSRGPCRRTVETIFSFEKCGLIYAPWADSTDGKLPNKVWVDYINDLLNTGSYYHNSDLYILWVKYDLCATPLGIELVDRFNLGNANETDKIRFESFLETLFAEKGMKMSF